MTTFSGEPGGVGGRRVSAAPGPPAGTPGQRQADDDGADDDVAEAEVLDDVADAESFVGRDIGDMLGTLERERDEYLDMVRRVQADFENYKKRVLRQQTDHLERAGEDLVTKMLPVLDAFDLARAHLGGGEPTDEGKALVAGSTLLADTLAREGLERIDDAGALVRPHHARSGGARCRRGCRWRRRRTGGPGGRRGAAGRISLEGTGDPSRHGAGAGVTPPRRSARRR